MSLTTEKPISPLPIDAIEKMYNDEGPVEGTPQHTLLAKKYGFKYRTLLGECMFCYTSCRPDIGYSITALSQFSARSNDVHFQMLKGLAKYLRKAITWSIRYKRTKPQKDLPTIEYDYTVFPSELPTFPVDITQPKLIGFVDAAHGNNLRKRRSTTGYVFTYC